MPEIEINAIYRHYKGGLYKVTGIAKHHHTLEKWVIYTSPMDAWIRPLEEFTGRVLDTRLGIPQMVERFEYVGPGGR